MDICPNWHLEWCLIQFISPCGRDTQDNSYTNQELTKIGIKCGVPAASSYNWLCSLLTMLGLLLQYYSTRNSTRKRADTATLGNYGITSKFESSFQFPQSNHLVMDVFRPHLFDRTWFKSYTLKEMETGECRDFKDFTAGKIQSLNCEKSPRILACMFEGILASIYWITINLTCSTVHQMVQASLT